MKTIDLVVPCYNEEEGLAHFVTETNKVIDTLPDYRFRYILVNDGSRDKTYLVMKQLARRYDNIKYISFSRNFGKEAAMYAGLQHTTADYVVVMDADLQHPPEVFPQMIAALEEGYPIPEPGSDEEYSGQFKLRIPKSLHRQLAMQSKREGISMNQYCLYLLSRNSALRACCLRPGKGTVSKQHRTDTDAVAA